MGKLLDAFLVHQRTHVLGRDGLGARGQQRESGLEPGRRRLRPAGRDNALPRQSRHGLSDGDVLALGVRTGVGDNVVVECESGSHVIIIASKRCYSIRLDPHMAAHHLLRILLAEDNVVNQKLAMRQLQQMGYTADLARNGVEAIESITRQPYGVVLMDVQMPEMDGLEATPRIVARWPNGKRPRIVAMSANAMQGDREARLAAGMDDYVVKPIRVDALVEALLAVGSRHVA